jgi:hypothetical protein
MRDRRREIEAIGYKDYHSNSQQMQSLTGELVKLENCI